MARLAPPGEAGRAELRADEDDSGGDHDGGHYSPGPKRSVRNTTPISAAKITGELRTLRIAATVGDGCNLPADLSTLDRKLAVLRSHCERAGRDLAELQITVLDPQPTTSAGTACSPSAA